ncbi:hypothetical protein EPI10_005507 [Gossypium australe]|uniref:Uncharacterized protein n=1 Tax=Gossypium australe TaxID=47621 RepID=A0A5B6WPK4_9ROSI|nr:hypothetical protein EPI10_005507 [Gossypium australe]
MVKLKPWIEEGKSRTSKTAGRSLQVVRGKFRVMESADNFCEVDAKELSLVPDLNMEKKPNKSFRQYTQRWRDVATQNLFNAHVVSPFCLKPVQPPFPKWYDTNAQCENHAGLTGHSIENYTVFEKLIDRFIKMRIVRFDNPSRPNVARNPLPSHPNQGVNVIIKNGNKRTKTNGHEIQECIEFRALVQSLMDNKELEFFEDIEVEPKKGKIGRLELSVNEPVTENEAKEFLIFLKHGEYSVAEHLHKQPTRISVLALLLSLETHRNTLMVLNETYVDDNISVNKLDCLVNNLGADNFIFFNDDEIPLRGMGSTKALHITTRCKGYTLLGVLIDNRSVLNVLPLSTLNKLLVDNFQMKACHNIVRAFDGTERKVLGRIEIPLLISLNTYEVDFLEARSQRQKYPKHEDGPTIDGYKPDARQKKNELEKKQERRKARLSGGDIKWGAMIIPHISETFV